MKIEQIYTGCLAQGAYYIESKGEVAVIDPLRETKPYIERAEKKGDKIKYIFETHFHADFVSGHVSLAEKTGAEIIFGPTAETDFKATIAKDNQEFQLGDITIKVLHTPGHTMESSCYLLIDKDKKEQAVFTGDTLFIGDVGRPDLAVKSDLTKEDLAAHLFDSLRTKIMNLSDDVIVYPAHGAGSACGKNMSKETFDVLGNQKKVNYALKTDLSKEEFIQEVTSNLAPPPQYFPKNVALNKKGYADLDDILEAGLKELKPSEFEDLVNSSNVLMIDARPAQVFKNAFIPNSINIGINGNFAPWVGELILDLNQKIVIIAQDGEEEEVVTRLSRVGYDHTIGFLKGGIDAWVNEGKEVDSLVSITAQEFEKQFNKEHINVLDVRKPNEYASHRIDSKQVRNLPLQKIGVTTTELDKNETYYIHCGGGYRSMVYASILKSRGFEKVIDIAGGWGKIKETDLPLSEFICLSEL